ncbi:hypothetical protein ACFWF7_02120 [Nocardia sp. NPDC060256]|uniref:hypothetical protein n=1 Tax=unclassified Nocardia TaxID=2637762 RepID=UPI00365FA481
MTWCDAHPENRGTIRAHRFVPFGAISDHVGLLADIECDVGTVIYLDNKMVDLSSLQPQSQLPRLT